MGAFRSWRQRMRRSLIPTRLLRDVEELRLGQGRILVELNRNKVSSRLRDYEFKVFSQWGEDGITQRLIASVPIAHATFIEFGVEDFSESNCRFLMINNYSDLYFGASLSALAFLAERKGYSLVATESSGTNAFFVRTELLGADVRALSIGEAFVEIRQSRNREGRLDYLSADAGYAAIHGLTVMNVETGAMEQV